DAPLAADHPLLGEGLRRYPEGAGVAPPVGEEVGDHREARAPHALEPQHRVLPAPLELEDEGGDLAARLHLLGDAPDLVGGLGLELGEERAETAPRVAPVAAVTACSPGPGGSPRRGRSG